MMPGRRMLLSGTDENARGEMPRRHLSGDDGLKSCSEAFHDP
jgi:hypothetical protein